MRNTMDISRLCCNKSYMFILFSIVYTVFSSFVYAEIPNVTSESRSDSLQKKEARTESELSAEEDMAKDAGEVSGKKNAGIGVGSSTVSVGKNKKYVNYSFSFKEDGSIEFKQLLQWESLFGVLFYELTVKEKESGKLVIDHLRTEKNSVELTLSPGFYEYQVDAYNMLSQKETSSPWAHIEVKQAHNPKIESLRPATIWIEDDKWNLQVYGNDFTSDCEVAFVSDGIFKKRIYITPEKKTDKYMLFHFKKPETLLGVPYRVWIKDPSGIENISSPFIVKYKRPVSFYIGAGYSPITPFGDAFYKTHWKSPVYPLAFAGTVGFIFSRKSYGYFGFSSKNTFRIIDLKNEDIILKNKVFISTINFVYEWWFIRKLSLCASAGVGMAVNNLKFVYTSIADEGETFVDPTYAISVGLRAKLHRFVYMDVALRFEQLLNNEIKPVFFSPEIAVGFRY